MVQYKYSNEILTINARPKLVQASETCEKSTAEIIYIYAWQETKAAQVGKTSGFHYVFTSLLYQNSAGKKQ